MGYFDGLTEATWDAHQHVLGTDVAYVHVQTGLAETVSLQFEEYLGMLDDKGRGMAFGQLSAFGANPERGDRFTLAGRIWTVTRTIFPEDGTCQLEIIGPTEVA